MIKEAIILAGGMGTRLRSVVNDLPKCLAPINGKPFLHFLIQYLQQQGIEHFIFSVSYMHEMIEAYLKNNFVELSYQISAENEPLGTGGAIQMACYQSSKKNVLVCNGDTLYKVDIALLSSFHEETNAQCSLSLKPMINFDRYGVVELNKDHSVRSFKEKQFYQSGLINGGVYALNVPAFLKNNFPEKFSFEKTFLEKNIGPENPVLFGMVQDEYFIDIGIPEDYERAKVEFGPLNPPKGDFETLHG